MSTSKSAARAYAAAATHRSLREQEADVFRYASATLRRGVEAGNTARVRALADNALLWTLVVDLVRDPSNALAPPLRAAIVSLGLVVQRELRSETPDVEFIATMNETIARGLAGSPG